jgi:hypothetical protein
LHGKKTPAEMGGDAFREAGTLIIVFAPLYELFEPSKPEWSVFCLILFVGFVFLVLGIQIERKRP